MEQNIYCYKYVCTFVLLVLSLSMVCGQTTDDVPIKTTYRKDCIYEEPHHNIASVRRMVLHKTKTFADGSTKTESAYSPRWLLINVGSSYGWKNHVYQDAEGVRFTDDGTPVEYGPEFYSQDDSFCLGSYFFSSWGNIFRISYHTIGVPDLSNLKWEEYRRDENWNYDNLYNYGGLYGNPFNPDNPVEDWYFNDYEVQYGADLYYGDEPIRSYHFGIQDMNFLLYVDNQLFNFSDFKPIYDVELRVKDVALSNGAPAKVIIYECRKKYAGPDLYMATVDTVYQLSPEEAKQWKAKPITINKEIKEGVSMKEEIAPLKMVPETYQGVIWREEE